MIRRGRRGHIRVVSNDVGDWRLAQMDDDQDTDHLARLDDPEWLARVLDLVAKGEGPAHADPG